MKHAILVLETHLYSLSLNKSMHNNKQLMEQIKKAIEVLKLNSKDY